MYTLSVNCMYSSSIKICVGNCLVSCPNTAFVCFFSSYPVLFNVHISLCTCKSILADTVMLGKSMESCSALNMAWAEMLMCPNALQQYSMQGYPGNHR